MPLPFILKVKTQIHLQEQRKVNFQEINLKIPKFLNKVIINELNFEVVEHRILNNHVDKSTKGSF